MRNFLAMTFLILAAVSTTFARDVRLRVVDSESLVPVANAAITVLLGEQRITAKSSPEGVGTVRLPDETTGRPMILRVEAEGFVGSVIQWSLDDGGAHNFPQDYTFYLEKAEIIGGQVVTGDGKPVKGAEVHIYIRATRAGNERLQIWDKVVKTGEDGRWNFPGVPRDLRSMHLRVIHPDYRSNIYAEYGPAPKRPMETLFNSSDQIVLSAQMSVTGTVSGYDGKAVADASVRLGSAAGWPKDSSETKSDEKGFFKFEDAPEGAVKVAVQAEGYAPRLMDAEISRENRGIKVILSQGQMLRARVVDGEGKPVEGVRVELESWEGESPLEFHAVTNAEGRFAWQGAPKGNLKFKFTKAAYLEQKGITLTPKPEEQEVKLSAELFFRATVVDAETGEPIPKIRVYHGVLYGQPTASIPDDQVGIQRDSVMNLSTSKEGIVEVPAMPNQWAVAEQARIMIRIMVEADGYLPETSKVFRLGDGLQALEFKLRKGVGLSGTVKLASGGFAEGAKVYASAAKGYFQISAGGKSVNPRNAPFATVGADGSFALPPQAGEFNLVALHDEGWKVVWSVTNENKPEIALLEWGRIEGKVFNGTKPAAGQRMNLYSNARPDAEDYETSIQFNNGAVADEEGRFVLEKVASGMVGVSKLIETGPSMYENQGTKQVNLKPGETAEVRIGGVGRPVIGRFVVPEGFDQKFNWSQTVLEISGVPSAMPVMPDEVQAKGQAAMQEWWTNWMTNTEEGRNFTDAQSRRFGPPIKADGSFQIGEAPAGSYSLGFRALKPEAGDNARYSHAVPEMLLATFNTTMNVPTMPGGVSDEPLDLGAFTIKPYRMLKEGEAAPEFELETADGKKLTLADCKGKVIVLSMAPIDLKDIKPEWWGSVCQRAKIEMMSYVAKLDDPHLLPLFAFTHEDPDEARKLLGIKVHRVVPAYAGKPGESKFFDDYGYAPQLYNLLTVIGPDGKIVGQACAGLRPADFPEKVKAALEKAGK